MQRRSLTKSELFTILLCRYSHGGSSSLADKRRDCQILSERHDEFSFEDVMPDPADDDDVILQVVQVVREVLVILRSPRVVLHSISATY